MAEFPLDPQLAKMMVTAPEYRYCSALCGSSRAGFAARVLTSATHVSAKSGCESALLRRPYQAVLQQSPPLSVLEEGIQDGAGTRSNAELPA